jgi:hypothetical protein
MSANGVYNGFFLLELGNVRAEASVEERPADQNTHHEADLTADLNAVGSSLVLCVMH